MAYDVDRGGSRVLILGLILLLIGWLTGIGILTTLGVILLVIGAVLWILGSTGRPVGGRRSWWGTARGPGEVARSGGTQSFVWKRERRERTMEVQDVIAQARDTLTVKR